MRLTHRHSKRLSNSLWCVSTLEKRRGLESSFVKEELTKIFFRGLVNGVSRDLP